MDLTDEEIDHILEECSITYEYFDITQMMMIKAMLKRISINYTYGSGSDYD